MKQSCAFISALLSQEKAFILSIFNDSEWAAQNKAVWLIFASCFYSQLAFISFSKIYHSACNPGRRNEVVRFREQEQENHSSNVLL